MRSELACPRSVGAGTGETAFGLVRGSQGPSGVQEEGTPPGVLEQGLGGRVWGEASVPEQVRVHPRLPGQTAAVLTRAPTCPRAHAPAPGPVEAALFGHGVRRCDDRR